MPTWILATALMMMSLLAFTAGLILDSLARSRAEQLRIHYLSLPALAHAQQAARTDREKRKPARTADAA